MVKKRVASYGSVEFFDTVIEGYIVITVETPEPTFGTSGPNDPVKKPKRDVYKCIQEDLALVTYSSSMVKAQKLMEAEVKISRPS